MSAGRAPSPCPDEGRLLALGAGQAPSEALEAHLDQCADCLALLADLLRQDEAPGALRPGELLGPYRVERLLGQGAMGLVYQAVHEQIGRRVALKALRPEAAADPRLSQRLLGEARLVNQIGHPAIVQIFDYLPIPGGGVIVMEHLPGVTLGAHARARGGRLPEAEARAICAEVAEALAAAHARGVVHRDLKPDNVMLVAEPRGGALRARLLDFGLAKVLETDDGGSFRLATLSPEGEIVGTPGYLAPEQIEATGEVAGPADVYGLGATLHHLLAGAPPFSGSALSVLRAHLSAAPPPLRALGAAVSAETEALVLRMLAKAPALRPPMAEVAAQLASPAADR